MILSNLVKHIFLWLSTYLSFIYLNTWKLCLFFICLRCYIRDCRGGKSNENPLSIIIKIPEATQTNNHPSEVISFHIKDMLLLKLAMTEIGKLCNTMLSILINWTPKRIERYIFDKLNGRRHRLIIHNIFIFYKWDHLSPKFLMSCNFNMVNNKLLDIIWVPEKLVGIIVF